MYGFGALPVAVDIYLGGHDGPAWEVSRFRNRSGWLAVAEARMATPFGDARQNLVAAIGDDGEVYSASAASLLLAMPTSLPRDPEDQPPDELGDAMDALFWDFLGRIDRENLVALQEAEERAARRLNDFEARCSAFETKLSGRVRALRTERRASELAPTRSAAIGLALDRMADMLDRLTVGMRERMADARRETEALQAAVLSGLGEEGEIEHLYTVRWRARTTRRGLAGRLPVLWEERSGPEASWNQAMSGIRTARLGYALMTPRVGGREWEVE